ncbi:adenylate kinase [Marssonina coronariae]|uniref:Adenylate kinase n=1 Tax=Diplocarpon coronariae TaxID=2795749 RepID=A0A218Z4Z4_9HELO|nr:adenylate kinase [Marssonina coronariae]
MAAPLLRTKIPNSQGTSPSRIHILGASGSGVSTLGSNISSALSVPVFDVDDYYWLPTDPPFTTKRPIPSRIALLKPLLSSAEEEQRGWVLAGSIGSWGGELMEDVEHVIFVDTPTEVRMQRLREREFKRHGERIRAGGDMFAESQAFLVWAERYDDDTLEEGRSRRMHEEWLKGVKQPITRLQGDKEELIVIEEALEGLGRKSP